MKRIKPFIPAFCIFCCALLVNIIYNLTVARYYTPTRDSLSYQMIAFNIIDEHCFCPHPFIVTVDRAPLWPWIIAGLSLIVGRADIYDRLFLCCIGSGTCVFIYLFARDLFGRRMGIVAGFIASVYPPLYIYDGWMYTEALFTFLMIAVCYCVYRIQKDEGRRKRFWIICGVLLALLSLTRPNGIVIIGLVVLWAIFLNWRKVLRKGMLKNAALGTLVACVLIAPWTIRNYEVSHSFVPVATGDGTVLLGSYNDQVLVHTGFIGIWINPLLTDPQVLAPFPLTTCDAVCEVLRENTSKDAALQWIRTHLSSLPELVYYHLLNFWTPITFESDLPLYRFSGQFSSQFVLGMSNEFSLAIFALAALGLVVTFKRRWRELLFAYGVVLTTLGEIIVYYGNSRFRMPIEPILVILATGCFWWLTQDAPGTLRQLLRRKKTPVTEEEPQAIPAQESIS
jgi:hypothetical protein